MSDVAHREKEIFISGRRHLTTDWYRKLHDIGAAVSRLAEALPKTMQDDPDLVTSAAIGRACATTFIELINHMESFEMQSKDFEFSRLSKEGHLVA